MVGCRQKLPRKTALILRTQMANPNEIPSSKEPQKAGCQQEPCSPSDFPSLRAYWNHMDQFATDYRSAEELAALEAMHAQYVALTKLGWRDSIYCPKDRSKFLVITAGSTGVFPCHYDGEWPKGTWWIEDGGDLWPARPILFKPLPESDLRKNHNP